jgi:hypothetical protein
MLKDDIVSALDEKLRANASTYSSNPVFREFYDRTGSPVKKERQVSTTLGADGEVKPQRRRRQTIKAKDEIGSPYVTHPSRLFTFARSAIVHTES